MTLETTLDGLLNRRVTLEQPKQGYRVAVDTVLLAAAVPAQAGDHILDLGCGVGGAALALACRVPATTGVGMDIQPDLVDLFRRNIARNDFAAGWTAHAGDVTALSPDLYGPFDYVVTNPPYHDDARHDVSANRIKQTANSLKDGDLRVWIRAAARALKPSGTMVMIHRADSQNEMIEGLSEFFGEVDILPIMTRPNEVAKRVIIRARLGAEFSIHRAKAFVLHSPQGGYSDAAEAVLRHLQALEFQSP